MPGPRMPGRNFLFVPGPTNVPDRVMRAMMVAMEDQCSELAAIPAGESPANRDAMGQRRGYCIHWR